MLQVTKSTEACIVPKKLLNRWELGDSGVIVSAVAALNAGRHTARRRLPKLFLQRPDLNRQTSYTGHEGLLQPLGSPDSVVCSL